jgi:hypothetical protein
MMSYYRQWKMALAVLVVVVLAGLVPAATSQAQNQSTYFPQTGHYLGGSFRAFWLSSGGLEIFGYPITEEYIRNSDGKLVQYFERARFELQVLGPGRANVQLGLVGSDYMASRGLGFPRVGAVPNSATVRYFPETGHTLRGAFKSYWERRGGLGIYGFPLSEEVRELLPDGVERTVQYFERARFELHGSQVRLSLLGSYLAPCQRRPGLPPNAPPSGPVAEGDAKSCVPPTPAASGRVYPEVSAPGTVLGFEARGYEPGELVSLWMNLPNGTVRALPYQAIAGNDGGVLIGFRTEAGDPLGQWSLVGQGVTSKRTVLAPFRLQR